MAKQILNEQFYRMQKLAGLITEEQANENFAANFAARGGFNTKYGSGTSSPDSKDGNQGDTTKKANEKVVAFFSDIDKDQAFKSQVDKIEADFNTAWNTDKERYEKSGKWNQTRQDSLKGEWDRKKETLFLKKFEEKNQELEKSDPESYRAAYSLVSSIATGKTKVEDLKTSSPSLLGKIKGFFGENNETIKELEDFKKYLSEEENLDETISFETLERIEGIVNMQDLATLKAKIRILSQEWIQDGFEKEEIIDYLAYLVDEV
jgi:hypothetical protein